MENRLGLLEFGKQLLDSKDLDPVYILLQESGMGRRQLWKWLLAYWGFYHVGTASILSEENSEDRFWRNMMIGAKSVGNATHPRSPERRHFRGENAVKSVNYLWSTGIDELVGLFEEKGQAGETLTIKQVMNHVMRWEGFGPWIAFKVADMLERLGLVKVDFGMTDQFIYDSPAKGADLAWGEYGGYPPTKPVGGVITWAMDYILLSKLALTLAPPRYERHIGVQEAETILCKWHAHMGGHYHIGEDIESCKKALLRFSKCRTAQLLLSSGKRGGLWE